MIVKNFTVKLCDRKEVKSFIETWHYSKSINGLKSNFCLLPNNKILFNLPNFTVKDQIPDYKTNMDYPSVETDSWSTSDDDSFYYKIKN